MPGRRKTAFIYADVFLEHDTGGFHPEKPERLKAVTGRIEREDMYGKLLVLEPPPAPGMWLEKIHSREHINEVREASCRGTGYLHSADNPVSPGTYNAAVHAAGGVLRAVDCVMSGEAENAFCALRPPGHHALRNSAMGFCFFNNIAAGAAYAKEKYGLEKIAVIDWDVHHGNGTQEAFYEEPAVYYISVHREFFFPGTGAAYERGKGKGHGFNLNIPLPAGSGDDCYLGIFREKIVPAVEEFSPDFIMISAGFDAHQLDPLGGMRVTGEGFKDLTAAVKRLAGEHCRGRLVSVLEGGYDMEGLSDSVCRHLRTLGS